MKKILLVFVNVFFIFIYGCGPTIVKCPPNAEPIIIYKNVEEHYKPYTKSFEVNLKGAIKVLETVDASNLDITTKNSVTKLREDLDHYSTRTSELLFFEAKRSNQRPCDNVLRDRVSSLLDQIEIHSTEVEKLKLSVTKAISENNETKKETILKSAVVEFKGTQEEIDSKLASSKIEPNQVQQNNEWAVVFSADKTLEESKFEKNKLTQINIKDNIIIFRSNSYRLVSKSFTTKDEASLILSESRAKYRKDTYIVNLKTWCPNKINKGDYFICN